MHLFGGDDGRRNRAREIPPPDRRPKETTGNPSQATANAVESEIREFVRRDVSLLRPRRNENNVGDSQTVEKLNMLIQRAAGDSDRGN